jgi:hypothetical protein
MLTKCANPSCSAAFIHPAEGKLFGLETEPALRSSKTEATEYFWLCERCSVEMTLRLAQDGRVMATGLREALGDGPRVVFVSANREKGLLLRGISFLRSSDSREAHEAPIERHAMSHDWEQREDIVAAASSCPEPDCSSLVVGYRAAAAVASDHSENWWFTCPRCGMEFTVPPGDLIFQSVPKQWLSANTHVV